MQIEKPHFFVAQRSNNMTIATIIQQQTEYFESNRTLPINFRIEQLKKLKQAIEKYEAQLLYGLAHDLKKAELEAYMTEIGLLYRHLDEMIKKLPTWSKKDRVKTPIFLQPAKSYTMRAPFGKALIISPFNYPVLLSLDPLIGSIAGGNTTLIGLSEETPYTNRVIEKLIAETFRPCYITTYVANKESNTEVLSYPFEKIFFTGSSRVGQIVQQAAIPHFSSVTLELGGKSPVLITDSAQLKRAAERIVWGKMVNAGQTCVAPDFCLIPEKYSQEFLVELQQALEKLFGQNPEQSHDFGRIINQRHYDRLKNLIEADQELVVLGGQTNPKTLYIAPTILSATCDMPLASMREELFGPILPVLTYQTQEEALNFLAKRARPLAFYLFSEDKKECERLEKELHYGGMVINDTLLHLSNDNLPFGGTGASGLGVYHGEESLRTFTYNKSILKRTTKINLPLYYPPYDLSKLKMIKWMLKI